VSDDIVIEHVERALDEACDTIGVTARSTPGERGIGPADPSHPAPSA
jgi:hypothetical protein